MLPKCFRKENPQVIQVDRCKTKHFLVNNVFLLATYYFEQGTVEKRTENLSSFQVSEKAEE